jgi:hypothetical protein
MLFSLLVYLVLSSLRRSRFARPTIEISHDYSAMVMGWWCELEGENERGSRNARSRHVLDIPSICKALVGFGKQSSCGRKAFERLP